jgi:diguanylate cyclase (GGDEF)-like protein
MRSLEKLPITSTNTGASRLEAAKVSLRPPLIVLVLLAFIPTFGFVFYANLQPYRFAGTHAQLPPSSMFFAYDSWLGCGLAGLWVLAGLALLTAWVVSDLLFRRHVKAALVAVKQLTATLLNVHIRQTRGTKEISQLAATFAPMATSLEPCVKERKYNLSQLQVQSAERRAMEMYNIQLYAFYDQLTGLPNRTYLLERLGQTIERSHSEKGGLFAVLFLDLNRFQIVKYSLGHLVADQLIIATARRLETCVRPTDVVARVGSDEFAILLADLSKVEDATSIADHIYQQLILPFSLDGRDVFITANIGIALGSYNSNPLEGNDLPENFLRAADTAMYHAKMVCKLPYAVFEPAMHARAVARLQLDTDLRRAIERQELQVYYQPIVSLKSRRITGFEALVRWQHPQRGFLSPVEFIPVAEETGLIIAIGEWVLFEACRQLRVWQETFPAACPLMMNVNISGIQFRQPNLIEQIDHILQKTGLNPSCLKLEITESVVMENAELAKTLLEQLKARNIQLGMDDFGTGYCSLSYLHRFPLDTLKIDRSFVSLMGVGGENLEIVRTIATLAHQLGMDVIAEGVETAEQLAQLVAMQCEYGQGYFFAQPVDSSTAADLIATSLDERIPMTYE